MEIRVEEKMNKFFTIRREHSKKLEEGNCVKR